MRLFFFVLLFIITKIWEFSYNQLDLQCQTHEIAYLKQARRQFFYILRVVRSRSCFLPSWPCNFWVPRKNIPVFDYRFFFSFFFPACFWISLFIPELWCLCFRKIRQKVNTPIINWMSTCLHIKSTSLPEVRLLLNENSINYEI